MNQEETRSPCLDCEMHTFIFKYEYCDSNRKFILGRILSLCRNHACFNFLKEITIGYDEYQNCKEERYLDFSFDSNVPSKTLQEYIKSVNFQDYILDKSDKRCMLYVERNLEEWNNKEPENETDRTMRQMSEEAVDGHEG